MTLDVATVLDDAQGLPAGRSKGHGQRQGGVSHSILYVRRPVRQLLNDSAVLSWEQMIRTWNCSDRSSFRQSHFVRRTPGVQGFNLIRGVQ